MTYNTKQSCVIWIVFNRSISLIDGSLTGATTSSQSWPGRKMNQGALYIPQISLSRASPLITVIVITGTHFLGWGRTPPKDSQSMQRSAEKSTTSRELTVLDSEMFYFWMRVVKLNVKCTEPHTYHEANKQAETRESNKEKCCSSNTIS